jgi:hypothetical protein
MDYRAMSGHGHEKDAPLIMSVQRDYLRESLSCRQVNYLFHKYARMAKLSRWDPAVFGQGDVYHQCFRERSQD